VRETEKLAVAVIVPTLNERRNIEACLRSAAGFAELVVVDSGSTDGTVEIAEALGAAVAPFRWNGRFPKKRNWTLDNHPLKSEWALFLDADERVTPQFEAELRAILPSTPHSGFWINYDNHFMGRRLRHGVPQRKLALFRTQAGRYERIDEQRWSRFDMEIHEHPTISGTIGAVRRSLVHLDYRSLSHFIDKHNQYSDWEAQRIREMKRVAPGARLTFRQKVKYAAAGRRLFSLIYFLIAYVGYRGFLDGRAGFNFALLKAIYFYQIALKLRELALAEAGDR
jgi:glycosyltransferase involved in cell wall biosynthesis